MTNRISIGPSLLFGKKYPDMGPSLIKSISRNEKMESSSMKLIGQTRFYSKTPLACSDKSFERENLVAPQVKKLKRVEDYIGQVSSCSNLQKVWSTQFSIQSIVEKEVPRNKLQHPYSLQEFRSDPVQPPQPLSELQARFELEDLEWCFFKSRLDKFNQSFWETQSNCFEEYEAAVKLQVLGNKDDLTTAHQEELDCRLDDFYRSWLLQQKDVFKKYNWEWWGYQPALIKGGWKAQMRKLKWKIACWKYSYSLQNWKS